MPSKCAVSWQARERNLQVIAGHEFAAIFRLLFFAQRLRG
jgi:hypothetical protein